MRISDWSLDVCSSDLPQGQGRVTQRLTNNPPGRTPSRWQRPDTTHPYTRPGIPEDRQAALFCSNTFAGAASAASSCSSPPPTQRSEEHTSELQSLMRISYAVFCLKKKKQKKTIY